MPTKQHIYETWDYRSAGSISSTLLTSIPNPGAAAVRHYLALHSSFQSSLRRTPPGASRFKTNQGASARNDPHANILKQSTCTRKTIFGMAYALIRFPACTRPTRWPGGPRLLSRKTVNAGRDILPTYLPNISIRIRSPADIRTFRIRNTMWES